MDTAEFPVRASTETVADDNAHVLERPPRRTGSRMRDLRVRSRAGIGRVLTGLLGARTSATTLAGESIATVLVCRVNGRMGNALMLTPLLEQLHRHFPHAAIDVATAYPRGTELLGGLPGVRRVIQFPHKGVGMVWHYLRAVGRVCSTRYDLAIDPTPNSTSSRLILTLCRSRRQLGFSSEHQWARLTHSVPLEADVPCHRAIQPVYLLERALGLESQPQTTRLWTPLSSAECQAGSSAVTRALQARGLNTEVGDTFGYFAHATGSKTVERQYWVRFWDAFLALAPEAVPVEFLPSPRSAPVDPRSTGLHIGNPRALAAAMNSMRLFVSADTGPMHLASSTGVPTVALFRTSQANLYGPLKTCDMAVSVDQKTPAALAQICWRHWQARRGIARD